MGIGIGSYRIVIEGDGDQPRELDAIDSLQVPQPGWKMEIDGALYIVTDVRTVQDFDARSESDKLHTYPRVVAKRIGNAPTPPRPRNDDGDDGRLTDDGARVLQFRSLRLADATQFDERAEAKARDAHEAQRLETTRVYVQRIGLAADPTTIENLSRRQQERTAFDELAEERAHTAHQGQGAVEEHRDFPRPIDAEASAPIAPVTDAPDRTILPWRHRG